MKIIHSYKTVEVLKDDILKLYCSIKHPSLELLFLKMANVDANLFYSWLLRNKNIKSSLKNQSVYDAFDLLGQLRNTFSYGSKIDLSTIVRTVHEHSRYLESIPVIVTLSQISDPSIQEVVNPFRDIIDFISSAMKTAGVDIDIVTQDINSIKNRFIGSTTEDESKQVVKETIGSQRKKMFHFLLTRFTEEVSSAADSSGLNELASAVRSGALSKPANMSLSKVINLTKFDPNNVETARRLVDYVYKNYDPRMSDYNHDVVEVTMLNKAGSLTKEDIDQLRTKYEEKKDITKYLEEDDTKYPGLDAGDMVTFDKRLNPDYLLMLSSFFVIFQMKLKMPSGLAF